MFFFFKQKTAYDMRISDWSSDVCSSDLKKGRHHRPTRIARGDGRRRILFKERFEMRSGNERHIRKDDEAGLARSGLRACDAGSQRNRKWLTRPQPCDVEPQRRTVNRHGRRTACNMATERNRRKSVSRVLDERPAMQRADE